MPAPQPVTPPIKPRFRDGNSDGDTNTQRAHWLNEFD
jgi:hypothetical protein